MYLVNWSCITTNIHLVSLELWYNERCFAVSHALPWELSLVGLINVLYSTNYTHPQKRPIENTQMWALQSPREFIDGRWSKFPPLATRVGLKGPRSKGWEFWLIAINSLFRLYKAQICVFSARSFCIQVWFMNSITLRVLDRYIAHGRPWEVMKPDIGCLLIMWRSTVGEL